MQVSDNPIIMNKDNAEILVNIFMYCIMEYVIEFTKYLGVGLMSFSAILIGIGFQLQFSWNQHDFAIFIWILGGIIFLLSLISYIVFGILSWKKEHPAKPYYGFGFTDKNNNDKP